MAPETTLIWLKRLRVAGWLLVFCLPAYWAVTYSGLFRVFSDLQVAVFGDYMGLVSWTLCFLIVGIPSIYLSGRIDAIATRNMSPAETSAYYRRVYIGDMEKSDRYRARLQRNTVLILSCISMAGGLGVGGYFLLQSQLVGPLTTIDVASFNPDLRPASHYVEAAGFPQIASTVSVTSTLDGSTFETFYVPMTATNGTGGKEQLTLILKIKSRWRFDEISKLTAVRKPVSIKGILSHSMQYPAASQFSKDGVRIAANAWVLEDRESPDEYRMLGLALLLVLGGLGAVGVGGTWWVRRRK